MRIVVGTGAGGGYDAYPRLIARHMSKHIPGNPTVIVTNMPGAGSNTAANYIYSVAPKDGTQIGSVFAGALIEPLTSTNKLQFDPSRFQFLGSANDDVYVCIARKDAAPQTFKEVFEKEITLGASGSSSSAEVSTLLKNLIATKFRIVLGYVGSRSIALAIERNEVQGACGFSWPSISVTTQAGSGQADSCVCWCRPMSKDTRSSMPRKYRWWATSPARRTSERSWSSTSVTRPSDGPMWSRPRCRPTV